MTIILAHLDGDGICSASLIKMVKRYRNARVFFSHPAGLAHDVKTLNEDLIICDIAVDPRTSEKLGHRLERIAKHHQVIYLDHHNLPNPLPENVINVHDENVSATEIVFRYFYDDLPKYADYIALMGGISDYLDSTPLMQELLLHYERRSLFFNAGILAQGIKQFGRGPAYHEFREFVEKFSRGKHPCDLPKLTKAAIEVSRKDKFKRKKILHLYQRGEFIAWIRDPPVGSRSKVAHWIMGDAESVLGMTIRTINTKRNLVDITIRSRTTIDLRKIVPPIVTRFQGSAGGHAHALGVRILDRYLTQFLHDLDMAISKLPIPPVPSLASLIPFD